MAKNLIKVTIPNFPKNWGQMAQYDYIDENFQKEQIVVSLMRFTIRLSSYQNKKTSNSMVFH